MAFNLDPSIPLAVQPVKFNDAFSVLEKFKQDREDRELRRMQMEQQRAASQALIDERNQQTAAKRQGMIDTKTIDDLMANAMVQAEDGTYTYDRSKFQNGVVKAGLGHKLTDYLPQLDAMDTSIRSAQSAKMKSLAELGYAMDIGDHTPASVMMAAAPYIKNGILSKEDVAPFFDAMNNNPEVIPTIAEKLISFDPAVMDRWDKRKTSAATVAKTDAERKKLEMEMAGTLPAPPRADANAQESNFLLDGKPVKGAFLPSPTGGKYVYNGQDVTARAQVIPTATATANTNAEKTVDEIADGIIEGKQPPTLTGLYRNAAGVRAALQRKGYDLTKAQLDWQATTKHISTLNGAQQTRLRQAVSTAYDSLDVIDDLASKWKGGGFPPLNRVSLAAAKNGVNGPEAASIARQLEGQITDVVSELGQVYMGGNSPTDHALQLAQKNLSADWSESVLKDMTKLARTNLQIRRNSMEHIGAAGGSANNQYEPQTQTANAPAPAAPQPARAAAKVGEVRMINGVQHKWNGSRWEPVR